MTRKPASGRFALLCAAIVLEGIALRTGIWLHFNALDEAGVGVERNWFVEDIYYPTWNAWMACSSACCWPVPGLSPTLVGTCEAHANLSLLGGIVVVLWRVAFRSVPVAGHLGGWRCCRPDWLAGAPVRAIELDQPTAGAGMACWPRSLQLYLSHKLAFHAVKVTYAKGRDGNGYITFVLRAGLDRCRAALYYAVERPFLRLRECRATTRSSPRDTVMTRPAQASAYT